MHFSFIGKAQFKRAMLFWDSCCYILNIFCILKEVPCMIWNELAYYQAPKSLEIISNKHSPL